MTTPIPSYDTGSAKINQPTVHLTNTFSQKKEPVVTQRGKPVTLYVCGITPYDYAHLGHGRCYVVFDLLCRLLQSLGHTVRYCRNFTDIDDKLLVRASNEFGDQLRYKEIADRYIAAFGEDMQKLCCLAPDVEPRVTETIPDILGFILQLIDCGAAYVVNGSVYFSVKKFPSYGALSKRNIEELIVGARVEVNEEKRDALDFALWKAEPAGLFWESPWGWGRPGWHIECSVMASKHLGIPVDIHGGGMDLIFPHHENERAQSEALCGAPYVRYWVHNAFVRIHKEKMSKSLGNFFTLRDVFASYDPMVVRFMILCHHYRSPLDFSFEELENASKSYQRITRAFVDTVEAPTVLLDHPIVSRMIAFLCDDLNTPGALGVLFESLASLATAPTDRAAVKTVLTQLFGLSLEPLPQKEQEMTPEIKSLLDEREHARAVRDWKRADELRDKLRELGFEVQDKKAK